MHSCAKLPGVVSGDLSCLNSNALDALVTRVLLENGKEVGSSLSNSTVFNNQLFKETFFGESSNSIQAHKRKADDSFNGSNVKRLKSFLESLNERVNELKMFRSDKCIMQHCSRVKLQLRERTRKAMKELNEIRTEKLKQIAEYQKQNLKINEQTASEQNKAEKEALSAEIDAFFLKTSDSFLNYSDFTNAFDVANDFEKRIQLLETKRRIDAFNGEPLTLNYCNLLSDRDHLNACFNLKMQQEPEG